MTAPASVQHTTAGWARGLTAALVEATPSAMLDAARHLLATGNAGALNVNQGFVTTKFPLPAGRTARPRLLVTQLTDSQWDLIEAAITTRPDAADVAGTAAISDQLADPAHTAAIPLLPSPSDITHTCTCIPQDAAPCAHSAAVGLMLADRIRTSPAALFTLRGRPHQHLKKRLRLRTSPPPALEASPPDEGAIPPVRRRQTLPSGLIPAKPPAPLPEPADLDLTGSRPVLTADLGTPPPPLPALDALRTLTADAAHRATSLLAGTTAASYGEETAVDLARLVTLPHGAPYRLAAMDHLGLDLVSMNHLLLAYTHGGPGGGAAYLEPFTVDPDVLTRAQADIQPLRPAPHATIECQHNHLTDHAAGIQLRYGPDARWHPYRNPYGPWQPVPGSSPDPAHAYRAARAGRSQHSATRPQRR